MSNPQSAIVPDYSKASSSSTYNFANFQMGPAGSVISILLKMNEIDLEIGQLDNELATLNNRASSEEANAVSTLQKDQGEQQKADQVLSGVGEISGGVISLAGAVGGEIYSRKASQNLSAGEEYTKPVDKSDLETELSNLNNEPTKQDLLEDPAVKKRLQQMKTNLDITKAPDAVLTPLENSEQTVTDKVIMKLADDKDVEAIQKHAREQIDKRTTEIRGMGERINLLTPGLQHLTQGGFSVAAANHKAIAKDDEAEATIAQNLISSFNSNQSLMQGQATSSFGLIPAIAQYIEQLLMANKYNGG